MNGRKKVRLFAASLSLKFGGIGRRTYDVRPFTMQANESDYEFSNCDFGVVKASIG